MKSVLDVCRMILMLLFGILSRLYALADQLFAWLDLKFNFVLPWKFQTDNLEYRFSQYRELPGGNFHSLVLQIKESNKIYVVGCVSRNSVLIKNLLIEFAETQDVKFLKYWNL